MSEELIKAFDKLNVNEKRNQINSELQFIFELIKNIENHYSINNILNIKNYDIFKNRELTESEILSFIYEDIYNIQRELITILTIINKK